MTFNSHKVVATPKRRDLVGLLNTVLKQTIPKLRTVIPTNYLDNLMDIENVRAILISLHFNCQEIGKISTLGPPHKMRILPQTCHLPGYNSLIAQHLVEGIPNIVLQGIDNAPLNQLQSTKTAQPVTKKPTLTMLLNNLLQTFPTAEKFDEGINFVRENHELTIMKAVKHFSELNFNPLYRCLKEFQKIIKSCTGNDYWPVDKKIKQYFQLIEIKGDVDTLKYTLDEEKNRHFDSLNTGSLEIIDQFNHQLNTLINKLGPEISDYISTNEATCNALTHSNIKYITTFLTIYFTELPELNDYIRSNNNANELYTQIVTIKANVNQGIEGYIKSQVTLIGSFDSFVDVNKFNQLTQQYKELIAKFGRHFESHLQPLHGLFNLAIQLRKAITMHRQHILSHIADTPPVCIDHLLMWKFHSIVPDEFKHLFPAPPATINLDYYPFYSMIRSFREVNAHRIQTLVSAVSEKLDLVELELPIRQKAIQTALTDYTSRSHSSRRFNMLTMDANEVVGASPNSKKKSIPNAIAVIEKGIESIVESQDFLGVWLAPLSTELSDNFTLQDLLLFMINYQKKRNKRSDLKEKVKHALMVAYTLQKKTSITSLSSKKKAQQPQLSQAEFIRQAAQKRRASMYSDDFHIKTKKPPKKPDVMDLPNIFEEIRDLSKNSAID
ncbi:hypothetical protein DID73_02460 [Candidatus Marinamargulisbacteria bacterium SCGC AG-343-K17]|nr:hypothetical protein DID73_02460 [Candidatus Marinamargulisbacteria bacterium SCGC AG-343-K17]